MPTINSIAKQASMVASLQTKFFGSDFAAGNNSVLVGSAFNTLNNAVKSEYGGQPALTNLVENYQARRDAFRQELNDNMQSLKDSSDRLKESTATEEETATETVEDTAATTDSDPNTGSALSNLAGFANGNIPPQERNMMVQPNNAPDFPPPPPETEELTEAEIRETMRNNFQEAGRMGFEEFTERYLIAENEDETDLTALEEIGQSINNTENSRSNNADILNNIRSLVNDYNSARNYLNENRGLSNRMSALADNFGGSRELSESLMSIGIFMNSDGELSINETVLQLELDRNADNVNSIVGGEGLAGQIDREVERASSQSENLFPSIYDYSNNNTQDITESLYSRQNFNTATYAWDNVSRFLTMLT